MTKQLSMLPPLRAKARRSDPETSHEAAASISSDELSRHRKGVYDILAEKGAMCDAQGLVALLETGFTISPSSYRSRRDELVKLGMVEFTDSFQRLPSGRRSRIWRVKAG